MSIGFNANVYQTMIVNFSKSLTYTPITKTTDNITGDETLTKGTPTTISGAFFKKDQNYNQAFEGLFKDADAILLLLPEVEINKNSLLTYDGEEYQNKDELFKRKLGVTHMYNVARFYLND